MSMQMGFEGNGNGPIVPERVNRQTRSRQEKTVRSSKKGMPIPVKNQGAVDKPPIHIQKTVADLERISHTFNKKLKFKVDHRSNEVMIKVMDIETDKVIRELPSDEVQRLRDRIRETIGLLFDEQV
jgi:uncharacterized FlaG/YvyC family protein